MSNLKSLLNNDFIKKYQSDLSKLMKMNISSFDINTEDLSLMTQTQLINSSYNTNNLLHLDPVLTNEVLNSTVLNIQLNNGQLSKAKIGPNLENTIIKLTTLKKTTDQDLKLKCLPFKKYFYKTFIKFDVFYLIFKISKNPNISKKLRKHLVETINSDVFKSRYTNKELNTYWVKLLNKMNKK